MAAVTGGKCANGETQGRTTLLSALLILLIDGLSIQTMWFVAPWYPQPQDQVQVWALPATKVYHCPKSRWYGKGSNGKVMGECQARLEGYSPAFGVGCGSNCG